MANTTNELPRMSLTVATSVLESEPKQRTFEPLASAAANWGPLVVPGFESLNVHQKLRRSNLPIECLMWVVAVRAAQIVAFPHGLVLQYAIEYAVFERTGDSDATRTLKRFAMGHLKADLTMAMCGEPPVGLARLVFLDERGFVLKTVGF